MKAQEAMLWQKERNGVRCFLCARRCFIARGKRGFCLVRENKDNRLYTLNYGKLIAVNVDPIEKKPLFHFYPGSTALSIAAKGCNFRCQFCMDGSTALPLIVNGRFKVVPAKKLDVFFNDEQDQDMVDVSNYNLSILGMYGPKKIVAISRRPTDNEMCEIVTHHGKRVKLTGDHKIMIWDGKKFVEKKVVEVSRGDKVKICTTLFRTKGLAYLNLINEFAKLPPSLLRNVYASSIKPILDKIKFENNLNFVELSRQLGLKHKATRFSAGIMPIGQFAQFVRMYGIRDEELRDAKITVRGSPYTFPALFNLTPSFMRLVGYFLAEGNYSGEYNLALTNKDEALLDDMKRCIHSSLDTYITDSMVNGKTPQIIFGGKIVFLLFRYVLGIDRDARNKSLPDIVFNIPKELLKESLSAYLTGDGTLCKKINRNDLWIRFITLSESLKTKLCYLLAMNGVHSTVQHPEYVQKPPHGKKGKIKDWRINVYGRDNIRKFMGIGVFLDRRQEKVEEYLKKVKSINTERGVEKIKEIRLVPPTHTYVYDIMLEGNESWAMHTFFAGDGILIHNCDNWQISQTADKGMEGEEYAPEQVVELAEKSGCKSISYTYTEPTIFFEFAYRTAKLAHRGNVLNTFVTNGYMTEEAVKKIAKHLDAATVDFKASADPEFYEKFMSVPDVQPIFDCLKQMKKQRIFIEITNLIVPQIGDSVELCRKLADHINTNLSSDIPFHILQFHPNYQLMEFPPTPVTTLERCVREARKTGLRHVYMGNVPGHPDENTYCYNCREPLIIREGYNIKEINLVNDRCPNCGFRMNVLTER